MQKKALRILSVFLAVVALSFAVAPVSIADEFGGGSFGGGAGRSDFFTWADGFHSGGTFGGGAGRGDLAQSKETYTDYVSTLPATGYNSAGRLTWQPSFSDLKIDSSYFYNSNKILDCMNGTDRLPKLSVLSGENGFHAIYASVPAFAIGFDLRFKPPLDGSYGRLGSCMYTGTFLLTSGGYQNVYEDYIASGYNHYFADSNVIRIEKTYSVFKPQEVSYATSGAIELYFPIYEVIPDTVLSGDTYNINTRPTSITGGSYGVIGDNGQMTVVNDNSTIVNETNNSYYNPATGQTGTITNWSYDYSDRSYNVTLQSGDTVTVTYGDEYITIQEGDTVYNVYYIIEGTGSDGHTHDWRESSVIDPTCIQAGKKIYTCAVCEDTKQETIPALGHDWRVKEIQQSYTIYECSRCQEQYRVEDGTAPPGGGSETDPGGEDSESLWSKLGELLGSILGGILALIESVVSAIFDALISLAEMVMDKLAAVVEVVLSLFEEIPKLFGGFLAFLTAVFPFLPPELMTILTFGLAAVVFIGIVKAVRR